MGACVSKRTSLSLEKVMSDDESFVTGEMPQSGSKMKLLVINPNSTKNMTDGLRTGNGTGSAKVEYHYFTAPSGPTSINNEDDAAESAKHCITALQKGGYLTTYDAFLVACYSQHPLVPWLEKQPEITEKQKPVTGIFEASVDKSLKIIATAEAFGIVSTGKIWEKLLSEAVGDYFSKRLHKDPGEKFAGVETTGLNATELHDAPPEEVRRKMKDATKRLVKSGYVGAICLGCAGMAGMDEMVREASIEALGEVKGSKIAIIDGVTAGIAWLEDNL